MYQATEGPLLGPPTVVMVCATIQLGSLGRDVSVNLVTPVTGSAVIGKSQFESSLNLVGLVCLGGGTHCEKSNIQGIYTSTSYLMWDIVPQSEF